MEYIVFSDESYVSAERYRSIGAVSFPRAFANEIQEDMVQVIKSSGVREFKWKELKDAKYRFCAEKFIKYLFENIFLKSLRIDVIIWDTKDCRHSIKGRDDIANFERMFFHLLKDLMRRREKDSEWYIFPDERMEIDWVTIQKCLSSVGKWREYFRSQLFGDAFSEQFFHIREFTQVDSKEAACCQVADFFAGMAVFSKNCYKKFRKWCDANNPQMYIFGPPEEIKYSNREKERFYVLKLFIDQCKNMKIGVSIETNKCLNTFDPNNSINFWRYTPQHPLDKAPVR